MVYLNAELIACAIKKISELGKRINFLRSILKKLL